MEVAGLSRNENNYNRLNGLRLMSIRKKLILKKEKASEMKIIKRFSENYLS